MWEYEVLWFAKTHQGHTWVRISTQEHLSPNMLEAFNAMGRDGWELVAISDVRNDGQPEATFKRPSGRPPAPPTAQTP